MIQTDLDFDHWRFGGGTTDSVLHPIVLVAMLAVIIVMLQQPRRVRLVVFLVATFLIPSGQQIVVLGTHVFVYRLIVLAGCARMIIAKRSNGLTALAGGWKPTDLAFVLCISFHVIAFCILYSSGAAISNQMGYVWDYLGGYVLLRGLIRDDSDITLAIKCFAYLCVILAACMVREQLTGENIFGKLGGVRLISQVREGRIRSEGVFQHAILAGTFAATLTPLLVWLWKSRTSKLLSVSSIIATAIMAITTACSTPLGTYVAGIVAILLWPFRQRMRTFRWGLVITLVGLHLFMKAPVWALIQRVDLVGGSSSYHRYQLVDQFIRHAQDWWLLGTKSNADWGFEMIDTSNAYVEEGTGGGGLALICFIALIASCFRQLGNTRKIVAKRSRTAEWLVWLLGCSLFAHVIAFFGIYYFDQTRVTWLALLAMVSAAASAYGRKTANLPAKWAVEPEPVSYALTGV
jgi:hypothetical protein